MTRATGNLAWGIWLATAVLLAGCGTNAATPSAGEPRVVEVMIDGYHFVPDHFNVRVGESVRFIVRNPDLIGHELYIGTIEEQAARRHNSDAAPANPEDVTHFGYGIYLPALTDGEFDYVFGNDGDLLIGCHIPGHWEAGMVATIDVEP